MSLTAYLFHHCCVTSLFSEEFVCTSEIRWVDHCESAYLSSVGGSWCQPSAPTVPLLVLWACLHTKWFYGSIFFLFGLFHMLQYDGVHIISGSLDTSIRVWDAKEGNCLHTLVGMCLVSFLWKGQTHPLRIVMFISSPCRLRCGIWEMQCPSLVLLFLNAQGQPRWHHYRQPHKALAISVISVLSFSCFSLCLKK